MKKWCRAYITGVTPQYAICSLNGTAPLFIFLFRQKWLLVVLVVTRCSGGHSVYIPIVCCVTDGGCSQRWKNKPKEIPICGYHFSAMSFLYRIYLVQVVSKRDICFPLIIHYNISIIISFIILFRWGTQMTRWTTILYFSNWQSRTSHLIFC